MRCRLRTLLILLAVLPPVIAALWFIGRTEFGPLILAMIVAMIAGLWLAPRRIDPPQY
jgi:hypothetical protein